MLGTIGLSILYALVFHRDNKPIFVLLALSLVAISELDLYIKLPLLLAFTVIFELKRDIFEKFFWLILLICVAIFGYFGGFDIAINSFKSYLLKESLTVKSELKFYDVVQTVREAGHINFDIFSQRISGSVVAFFLSLAGFVLLVKDKKIFIISLPMLGLGFLAMKAGLRFTVYAVPVMAFGYAYLTLYLSSKLTNPIKSVVIIFFMFFALVPNLGHIYAYTSQTVYTKSEAAMTARLGKIAGREDYVYTWWDYGYPVRYYADVKNHSDGGKHDGATNFIESSILCSSNQLFAANMMREATEKYEEMIKKGVEQNISTFEYMLKNTKVEPKNYQKYLDTLGNKAFVPSKKTRDVYLYLPSEMLEIFSTINQFSNINLLSGESKGDSFLETYEGIEEKADGLYSQNQKLLDKKNMKLYLSPNGQDVAIYAQISNKKGGPVKSEQNINPNGYVSLIYLKDKKILLVADDKMYHSLFIQMFLLDNYDKSLFEPVEISDELKIYKLKI
jgi:dolichyl-diphosphooligosaccharide--protein glycosyltransferase/undecaprenyl-diphosphooligosaccharide--protein glycosyltransferase